MNNSNNIENINNIDNIKNTKIECPKGSKIKFNSINFGSKNCKIKNNIRDDKNNKNKKNITNDEIKKLFIDNCQDKDNCMIDSKLFECNGFDFNINYACVDDLGKDLLGSGSIGSIASIPSYKSVGTSLKAVPPSEKIINNINGDHDAILNGHNINDITSFNINDAKTSDSINIIKNEEESNDANINEDINNEFNGKDVGGNFQNSKKIIESFSDIGDSNIVGKSFFNRYKNIFLTFGAIIIFSIIVYLIYNYVYNNKKTSYGGNINTDSIMNKYKFSEEIQQRLIENLFVKGNDMSDVNKLNTHSTSNTFTLNGLTDYNKSRCE